VGGENHPQTKDTHNRTRGQEKSSPSMGNRVLALRNRHLCLSRLGVRFLAHKALEIMEIN